MMKKPTSLVLKYTIKDHAKDILLYLDKNWVGFSRILFSTSRVSNQAPSDFISMILKESILRSEGHYPSETYQALSLLIREIEDNFYAEKNSCDQLSLLSDNDELMPTHVNSYKHNPKWLLYNSKIEKVADNMSAKSTGSRGIPDQDVESILSNFIFPDDFGPKKTRESHYQDDDHLDYNEFQGFSQTIAGSSLFPELISHHIVNYETHTLGQSEANILCRAIYQYGYTINQYTQHIRLITSLKKEKVNFFTKKITA